MPPEYKDATATILPMTPKPDIFIHISAEYLSHDREYVYYKMKGTVTNHGPASARNVTVELFAEAAPYDMTRIWPPGHTIHLGTLLDDEVGYVEGVLKVPRKNNTRFSCVVHGDNFNAADVQTNIIYVN
jgi:hypothetical protein